MILFVFAFCISQFAFTFADDPTKYVGFVTKVKGISKEDIETRREEIVVKLNRESKTVITDALTGDEVDVLYNDTLTVHGRIYTFTPHSGECTYGPVKSPDDKTVYLHERDLTSDENTNYLKDKNSYPKALRDAKKGDMIVPSKSDNNKFALVRPVSNVTYTCETDTFCCGLRCCPTALKDFLTEIRKGNKKYQMDVHVDAEQDMTLFLKPQVITNSTRNCGYIIDSNDYYPYFRDQDMDAVRYKCPKNYTCCAETLCCKRPSPYVKEKTFGTWIAGLKSLFIALFVICGLLFVAGLWYYFIYRPAHRPPPFSYLAPLQQQSTGIASMATWLAVSKRIRKTTEAPEADP